MGVGAVSLFTGCCLGAFLTLNTSLTSSAASSRSASSKSSKNQSPESTDYLSDDELSSDEKKGLKDEDSEDEEIYEVNSTSLNQTPGEVRMALVVRTDLGMTRGKMAAQCAHAAVTCYKLMDDRDSGARNAPMLRRWYAGGQAKIALKCKTKEEMDLLYAKALSLNINAYVVHDAGRTQIPSGSATVLGLGPAPKLILDQVTRKLHLL